MTSGAASVIARRSAPALVLQVTSHYVVQAQSMLLEKITAANCARARASQDPDACRRVVRAVPRSCIFPGSTVHVASVGRRQVMLLEGSHGARMSETELGAAIGRAIDSGLTQERFLALLDWLAAAPGEFPALRAPHLSG